MHKRAAILLFALWGAGCGGPQATGSLIPDTDAVVARCRYGSMQTSLLVTEWSAAEKADLEALMNEGRGIAVAFSGCQMRVLPQCNLRGAYGWLQTTPSSDYVEIRSESELYTKLPLGAVSLSGELKRSGALTIETVVAGQKRLMGLSAAEVPNEGACAEATHIVNALSLGAFVMTAGGEASASGGIDVSRIGNVGGSQSRSARVVRSAGNAQACQSATGEVLPVGCASPIQVFLAQIPGRGEQLGAPGTVKVDFVSQSATTRWDVYVDDQATCTTPCSRWVDPARPLVLQARDLPDKVRVGRLDPSRGPLQISARPKAQGRFLAGLTFTALGGMGVVAGIALTAVGCSDEDRDTMCNAGLITLAGSSVVTAGALYLLLNSGARLKVRPLFGRETRVMVGPGFVAGTF